MHQQAMVQLPLGYPHEAEELLLALHRAILAAELQGNDALALRLTGIYDRLRGLVRVQG